MMCFGSELLPPRRFHSSLALKSTWHHEDIYYPSHDDYVRPRYCHISPEFRNFGYQRHLDRSELEQMSS